MLPTLLPFERLPVTILVLTCYLAVIISTIVIQERLPAAPKYYHHRPGLDLNDAWNDLHAIAQIAHPFNSHANDDAGKYLTKRLKSIQDGKDFMHLDVDMVSNATWHHSENEVTYMESRNIVVKVDGSEWNDSAIMFTAHYDTSSLAPGATDDTIAVVSLLQIAEFLAHQRPRRSIILLFNDGEEDGLHGAHVFLEHPWARLVQSFVNVEGAGAGGRPNLFRTSSAQITQAFKSATHPHGTSLFSDAWGLGLVRSTTDYDVYTRAGIPGADYAFYMGRQKYHTMYDTVSSLRDRRPLWSMMENLHGVVEKLSHVPSTNNSEDTHFVYFDLFGEALFYLRFDFFIVLNILLILLGPIPPAFLIYSLYKRRKLHFVGLGWGRFLSSLFLGIVMGGICVAWYTQYNPMIIYKSPYWVLICLACFIAIGLLLPAHVAARWLPVPFQRAQAMIEMTAFWWLMALVNLIFSARKTIAGTYFVTFFYAASLSAVIVTLLDMYRVDSKLPPSTPSDDDTGGILHQNDGHNPENATERTPLLAAEEVLAPSKSNEDRLGWVWALEFLLVAIFPAILMLQLMLSLLSGLGPTVVDGSKPILVYIFVVLTIFLTVLPIIPFAHKLPLVFFGAMLIIGASAVLYTTLDFPFSSDNALKIFFQQSVDLEGGSSAITLTGLRPYLETVVKDLPSTDYDQVQWSSSQRPGLSSAEFPGQIPRSVAKVPLNDWVNISAKKINASRALIRVDGRDTRACRLKFETDHSVSQVTVRGSNAHGDIVSTSGPVKGVNLWRRMWSGAWEVEVEFAASDSSDTANSSKVLGGRVSCNWSERTGGKIPALDELYVYFPTWATMTAWSAWLVEGWKTFSV